MLATAVRTLYAGPGPRFGALKQGEIGDCYFFCMAGYLAARDPQRIVRMIRPQPGGGFAVGFFDGTVAFVTRPTEAEMLVNNSASSLGDGLWLPVLEKALGEVLRSWVGAAKQTDEVTDAMASGGHTSQVIRLFSGFRPVQLRLRDSGSAAFHVNRLRRLLPVILARRKLAAVCMGADPPRGGRKVPGLGYNHGYAILGYDPETDLVTVWNPWGQDFHPEGPDGVAHGFTTEHGVFRLPLTTLYRQFSVVLVEPT